MTAPAGSVEAASFTDAFLVKVGVRLPGSWDPSVPVLSQLVARVWMVSTATRLRRFTVLPLAIHLGLTLLTVMFPASAHASVALAGATLAMLTVSDSYGVPLSQYAFSTNNGNIMDTGSKLMLAVPLRIEAAVFVIIGGFAIWLLIWILDFGLLTVLVEPIAFIVQSYASQVFPGVTAIAAVIAALVIAINVIRGDTPKAVGQAAAALVVAVLAGFVAYAPISWAVSEDGPIRQGRDLAIAAATNSSASSGHTHDRLAQMEGMLGTNFVRGPLQIWNFGARADETPACAAAWSAGAMSGDSDQIKDGVEDCGAPNSRSMKDSADNPSPGQVANGILLIVLTLNFLVYVLVVAFRVIIEFARCTMSACKLLWGLAVGFIPGPGQRSIYTSAVELGYSAVAMFGYVTITMFVAEMFVTLFRHQDNFFLAQFSSVVLMWIASWMTLKLGRNRAETSASVADSILNGLGATGAAQAGGAPGMGGPGVPPVRALPNTTRVGAGGVTNFAYNMPPPSIGKAVAIGIGSNVAGEALARVAPGIGGTMGRFTSMFPNGPLKSFERGLDEGKDKREEKEEKDKEAIKAGPGRGGPPSGWAPPPSGPSPGPIPGMPGGGIPGAEVPTPLPDQRGGRPPISVPGQGGTRPGEAPPPASGESTNFAPNPQAPRNGKDPRVPVTGDASQQPSGTAVGVMTPSPETPSAAKPAPKTPFPNPEPEQQPNEGRAPGTGQRPPMPPENR